MRNTMKRIVAAVVAAALLGASAAGAQDSLAGKNVTLIIGFGAGGGYDLWGRLVARQVLPVAELEPGLFEQLQPLGLGHPLRLLQRRLQVGRQRLPDAAVHAADLRTPRRLATDPPVAVHHRTKA